MGVISRAAVRDGVFNKVTVWGRATVAKATVYFLRVRISGATPCYIFAQTRLDAVQLLGAIPTSVCIYLRQPFEADRATFQGNFPAPPALSEKAYRAAMVTSPRPPAGLSR